MKTTGVSLLIWVFFIHLAGIYLFTRGFLLTRLSLPDFSSCPDNSCTLPATHKRTVVLIIDALRFDFLSPQPPDPPSPYHHNVLTLPRELTEKHPDRSFLFNAFADPPTTTLQRIKGITTGSLPTFVDMGSNFGASSIEEDSIIKQLHLAGKKIAFMGDDTWLSVFPTFFSPNLTFPYDSFNVEDLHTVDTGVITHLFPLLSSAPTSWDFAIGHFLGVDHAGHRVGPDHPTMKAKLSQMNEVLREAVEKLDEDTFLVVMGDHGMDRRGDHGGDGELETSCALWFYSKIPFSPSTSSLASPITWFSSSTKTIPLDLFTTVTFPGTSTSHRRVQQIDLVPTLSLLLGQPIPYNNLGTVIPELFPSSSAYTRALQLNAEQIKKYLDTYRSSPSGGELDPVWSELTAKWDEVNATTFSNTNDAERWLKSTTEYTRFALSSCRSLWAQFNVPLMSLGLILLVSGVLASYTLYSYLGLNSNSDPQVDWDETVDKILARVVRGAAGGAVIGFLAFLGLSSSSEVQALKGLDALDLILFASPLVSCLSILVSFRPPLPLPLKTTLPLLPLLLHTLSFFSNSFTLWEDHVTLYLLTTTLLPTLLTGLRAPTNHLRLRILGFSSLFALSVRLMAVSTVCREEQHPYCHVTFFASEGLPSPPRMVLYTVVPVSLAVPFVIKRFLGISMSDQGLAGLFLPWVLTPTLLAGNAVWVMEWLDSGSSELGADLEGRLRGLRTFVGRAAVGGVMGAGLALWWMISLCIRVIEGEAEVETESNNRNNKRAEKEKKKQVTVLGFANVYGSPYLIFWTVSLGVLFIHSQVTGQIVLALAVVAVLSHLEVVDSVRDVQAMDDAFASGTPSTILDQDKSKSFVPSASGGVPIRFGEIVPLALLALHTFHATGHQHTIPSIQWKTAFVLTGDLSYPLSPLSVIINTFGPYFLLALSAPLLGSWNIPPRPQPQASRAVLSASVRAALGMMIYFGCLLVGSAGSAAWLRRHLMVWKIFAPRFMSAAAGLVAVDLGVIVALGFGMKRVVRRVSEVFRSMSS